MQTNPLVLVFLPTVYMLGACLSLIQFQVAITLIARGVAQAKTISMLEPALPGAYALLRLGEDRTASRTEISKAAPEEEKYA